MVTILTVYTNTSRTAATDTGTILMKCLNFLSSDQVHIRRVTLTGCRRDSTSTHEAEIHSMASTRLQKKKGLKADEHIYANTGKATDNTSTYSNDSHDYEDVYAPEAVHETCPDRRPKGRTKSGTHTHIALALCDPPPGQEGLKPTLEMDLYSVTPYGSC